MDRFEAMRLFSRVVELGSFSRAAEQLTLSRASATLLIKQLEAHLGTKLLLRTTRQVRTTVDGEAYYQRCKTILADIEDIDTVFRKSAQLPQGRLKINLSGSLCRIVVIPALPDFCQRYPEVILDIGVDDKHIDLVSEGVDCVLRIGELRDSPLVARPLATFPQLTCASIGYLEKFGTPRNLQDLENHRVVDYFSASNGKSVPLEFFTQGQLVRANLAASLAVNNGDAYVAACEADFGIIQVPYYHVQRQIRHGLLREILTEYRPPPLPLSALYPKNRHLSPRLRVFIDWMSEILNKIHP